MKFGAASTCEAYGEWWVLDPDGHAVAGVAPPRNGRVSVTVEDGGSNYCASLDADQIDALIALLVEQRAALRYGETP